jgi:hypothetical protein
MLERIVLLLSGGTSRFREGEAKIDEEEETWLEDEVDDEDVDAKLVDGRDEEEISIEIGRSEGEFEAEEELERLGEVERDGLLLLLLFRKLCCFWRLLR